MVTPINFLMLQLDPNYQMGFQNGYECAKKEMAEKLERMSAFAEETGTVVFEMCRQG